MLKASRKDKMLAKLDEVLQAWVGQSEQVDDDSPEWERWGKGLEALAADVINPKGLTIDMIKGMSTQEIAERRDEVTVALRRQGAE